MLQKIQTKLTYTLALVALVFTSFALIGLAADNTHAKGKVAPKAVPAGSTSDAQLARGQKMFKQARCESCHAGGGNSLMPDHPIKGQAFAARYKNDKMLEDAIRNGFPESGMAGFEKDDINDAQMKDLILYIRSLTPKGK